MAKPLRLVVGGPLDGLGVRFSRPELRFLLRHRRVTLVALYEWVAEADRYLYLGTVEPDDVKPPQNAVVVNVTHRCWMVDEAGRPVADVWMPKEEVS